MPELQQPDIVGNFLSSYGTAQAQQQAQKDRAFQQQRVMRQDDMAEQQFGMQKQKHQFEIAQQVVDMLGSVQDGDEMGFERAKQRWGQMGLPMEAVAGFTVADLPSLRVKAGTQLRELQAQQVRAQTAAANRSNRGGAGGGDGGMKAPAGYQWTRNEDGAIALSPITGGPADPNKLAPGEAVKVRTANAQLDALEQSLKSYISDLDKTTPMGRLISRGPEVSAVETGHTDLLMQMKNLYELGVLNGPDYTLMLKIVEDPTGFGQIARGTEGLKAQTDTVKSIINRSRNINAEKLGKAPAATAPAAGGGEMNWTFDAQGNLVPAK